MSLSALLPALRVAVSRASEKNSGMHWSAMSLKASVGPCHNSRKKNGPLVRPAVDLAHRGHVLVVEVGPVGRPADLPDLLPRHAQLEPLVDGGRAFPVGQIGQREDVGRAQSRHPLGHEQSAALRHPLEDDVAERQRLRRDATGYRST